MDTNSSKPILNHQVYLKLSLLMFLSFGAISASASRSEELVANQVDDFRRVCETYEKMKDQKSLEVIFELCSFSVVDLPSYAIDAIADVALDFL